MNSIDFDKREDSVKWVGSYTKMFCTRRTYIYSPDSLPASVRFQFSQHRVNPGHHSFQHSNNNNNWLDDQTRDAKCWSERPYFGFCNPRRICRQLPHRPRLHLFQKDYEPSTRGTISNVSITFNFDLLTNWFAKSQKMRKRWISFGSNKLASSKLS